MNQNVYIVSGVRTPIGSFNGSLSGCSAAELGTIVIKESLKRAGIKGSEVSEVIIGQVYTAGQGQNPPRQASMKAGIPTEVPAWGVSMLCGAGLKSVALGFQSILCGDSDIVVAGGMESMSQTPHACHLRNGKKMGDANFVDTLLNDGLIDAFCCCQMGVTGENVAKKYSVSREDQDEYAYKCQIKTKLAIECGYFQQEIIPVIIPGKKGNVEFAKDEHPRPDSTVESLKRLKPCFVTGSDGTVTAGNASGVNDGASAVVLVNETVLRDKKMKPLARIISWAQTGVQPEIMGMGPVTAVHAALKKAGWNIKNVDVFELNEPMAAVAIALVNELGIDEKKVNIHGGAIALGHPLGASGTRVLVTLIYALKRTGGKKGVASLCIGGGMGIAMCIEIV